MAFGYGARLQAARSCPPSAKGGMGEAWVAEIVEERLESRELERLWREFYQSVRPRRSDIRRADALFDRLTRRRRRKAA